MRTTNSEPDQAPSRSKRRRAELAVAAGLLLTVGFFVASGISSTAARSEISEQLSASLSPEAYEVYQEARRAIRQPDIPLQEASTRFEHAIALAPDYAPAFSGLAAAHAEMAFQGLVEPEDGYQRARSAARQAVQLDEELAEAHLILAMVSIFYEFDPANAEAEFRRTLELDPELLKPQNDFTRQLRQALEAEPTEACLKDA